MQAVQHVALAKLIRSSQSHFSNMKRHFKLELGTELHSTYRIYLLCDVLSRLPKECDMC